MKSCEVAKELPIEALTLSFQFIHYLAEGVGNAKGSLAFRSLGDQYTLGFWSCEED